MWLSLNWIKDFVDYELDRDPKDLGCLISLSVAEVEDVKIVGKALDQVRVVEVIKTEPHPDADKLKLATLTDGTEVRTIVCGASNCRPGIKLPFADIGAEFEVKGKDGKIEKLVIKPTKIRGVESTGMLCSEEELGLADSSDGVLELPEDTPLGVKLSELEAYKGQDDILFEIDNKSLTHRPDLWGHYGFAREFATIFDLPLKDIPGIELGDDNTKYTLNNELPKLCRRYSALEVRNVKVGQSPEWMQKRLRDVGINSINNLVDITNYVLLELGQPMHAFDADKLKGDVMGIRKAKDGEVFAALDEVEYKLTSDDIVIDNNGDAVALAGVMGGLHSSIDENTVNVVLESANFDAATVRRTSTRVGLRSDSSVRFEKSLDPENTVHALKRAAQLILELCPEAEIVGGIIDTYDSPYTKQSIETSYEFFRKRLGHDIPNEFITNKLTRLGFELSGDLTIAIPSWRVTKDVEIAEDILEEVGRIYGFDNITPQTLKFDVAVAPVNKVRQLERKLKSALTEGCGFTEILLYPWMGDKTLKEYGLSNDGLMTLKNPISEDSKYMKPEAAPLFINAIAENLKYQHSLKMFDFTRIYDVSEMNGVLPTEKFKLIGTITPEYKKKDLQSDTFYEVKQLVQDLLLIAGVKGAQVKPLGDDRASWVHPGIGCGFYRGRQCLAEVYKLHPAIAKKKGIKHNAYIFQINIDELERVERKFTYKPISKFPSVPFDVTVVADERTLSSQIEQVINKAAKKYLKELSVFSVYQGEGVEEGKKAVSYRMTFASDKATLKPDEVVNIQNSVMDALNKAGYTIR